MNDAPKLTLLSGGLGRVEADPEHILDICGLKIDMRGRSPENLAAIAVIGSALSGAIENREVIAAVVVLQHVNEVDALDDDDAIFAVTTTTNLVRLLGYLEYIKQQIFTILRP